MKLTANVDRPSKCSPDLALELYHRIAHAESLRGVYRGEGMSHRDTVGYWLADLNHEAERRRMGFHTAAIQTNRAVLRG